MYKNFNHLSPAELSRLKDRYCQGEPVHQLLLEYNLQISPSSFYKFFPPDTVEKYGCSICNTNLVIDALPKSKQHLANDNTLYYCPICHRKPFLEHRGWITSPRLSDEKRNQLKLKIEKEYGKAHDPISYGSLSYTQKIYLGVLCNALLRTDGQTILPYNRVKIKLAATKELVQDIYKELLQSKAITISTESDIDAFDLGAHDFPKTYDVEKLTYRLNLDYYQVTQDIFDLTANPCEYSMGNEMEEYNLWCKIAVSECVEYLQYRLNKVGFDFSPGAKTHSTFLKLLEDYSVSQIYYIIWCKVNDASRWYLESKVSKPRAANSVIGACAKYGETALFYGRELPQYHKPKECLPNKLTQFFYQNVLSFGQEANNIVPYVRYY